MLREELRVGTVLEQRSTEGTRDGVIRHYEVLAVKEKGFQIRNIKTSQVCFEGYAWLEHYTLLPGARAEEYV